MENQDGSGYDMVISLLNDSHGFDVSRQDEGSESLEGRICSRRDFLEDAARKLRNCHYPKVQSTCLVTI